MKTLQFFLQLLQVLVLLRQHFLADVSKLAADHGTFADDAFDGPVSPNQLGWKIRLLLVLHVFHNHD
jgi:hypothetical protein